jgi:hypothetical protein
VKYYTVVIPTTNNLVGISDIVVEDPLVSSVICENNSLESLPISNIYASFVKSPTGIIEKITGHSSYRIDITNRIEQGDSWQLAIAIAHIFHDNNFLSFSTNENLINNNKHTIIWASGTINSNLDVKAISYLDQKIKNSINFFKQCIEYNITVEIVLSFENKIDLNNILENNKFLKEAITKKQIKLISIKNLKDFFDNTFLKNVFNLKKKPPYLLLKIKKYVISIIFSFIILLIIFLTYNIWQVITSLNNLKSNNNYRVLLTSLSSYRQGDFSQRVSAYLFDYFQSVEASKLNKQITLNFLPYSDQKKFQETCVKIKKTYNIMCKLNIEATNVGDTKIFLWMLSITDDGSLKSKKKINVNGNPEIINGMISSKETISIDIKDRTKPTILFFVYGKSFDIKIRNWLVNLSKRNSLLKSTVKRIKSLGYGYIIKKINNVRVIEDVL